MLELESVVPYFDLSLQHAAPGLLRRMKRWGSGDRFLDAIGSIRADAPDAAFRSSFIVGFPGETEDDHDVLLEFLRDAALDWAGFFPFSPEDGTAAVGLDGVVDPEIMGERLREGGEVQEPITQAARDGLVGRTHREAPEIDGVVRLAGAEARPGAIVAGEVTGAIGPDLDAVPLHATVAAR